MTADERFALIWHKIERANKHIRDLNAAIVSFMATNPYKVAAKRNPETRQPIYYVAGVQPVPQDIPIILGDAIQNLRTALDHLAQHLYLIGSGAAVYRKNTSFFVAPKASEYKRLVSGKVEKMRQEAIDALAALEPYGGGKGNDFWVLHCLNNIDKHRSLVATGASYGSVDVLPAIMGHMSATMKDAFAAAVPKLSLHIRPADNLCPLKIGDELFIGAPDEEINPDVKFSFDVALYEPEIIKTGPMLDTVQHLADLVSNTVTAFKPLLA
jgi:enamine deaminase RidA (YjgF/YER057c/UK114 family)